MVKIRVNRMRMFPLIIVVTLILTAACSAPMERPDSGDHVTNRPALSNAEIMKQKLRPVNHSTKPVLVSPSWRLLKSPPVTAEPVQLTFKFFKHMTKDTITDYKVINGQRMHFFVVSKDLRDYLHLTPAMQADGTFTVSMPLTRASIYKLSAYAISASQGVIEETAELVVRTPAVVANHRDPKTPPPFPAVNPPNLKVNWFGPQTVSGVRATLAVRNLRIGKPSTFVFTLRDAKSGFGLTGLQPHHGGLGHLAIISETGEQWAVGHPVRTANSGPQVAFTTVFEKPGKYKLWADFKLKGKTLRIPYVIEVKK